MHDIGHLSAATGPLVLVMPLYARLTTPKRKKVFWTDPQGGPSM